MGRAKRPGKQKTARTTFEDRVRKLGLDLYDADENRELLNATSKGRMKSPGRAGVYKVFTDKTGRVIQRVPVQLRECDHTWGTSFVTLTEPFRTRRERVFDKLTPLTGLRKDPGRLTQVIEAKLLRAEHNLRDRRDQIQAAFGKLKERRQLVSVHIIDIMY